MDACSAPSDSLLLRKVLRFDSRAGGVVARSQENQATSPEKHKANRIRLPLFFFIFIIITYKGLVVIYK